jgi:hypothetical protein
MQQLSSEGSEKQYTYPIAFATNLLSKLLVYYKPPTRVLVITNHFERNFDEQKDKTCI